MPLLRYRTLLATDLPNEGLLRAARWLSISCGAIGLLTLALYYKSGWFIFAAAGFLELVVCGILVLTAVVYTAAYLYQASKLADNRDRFYRRGWIVMSIHGGVLVVAIFCGIQGFGLATRNTTTCVVTNASDSTADISVSFDGSIVDVGKVRAGTTVSTFDFVTAEGPVVITMDKLNKVSKSEFFADADEDTFESSPKLEFKITSSGVDLVRW